MERVARDTGLLLSQEREGLIPNRFPARVGTARIGRESRGMPSMLPTEPNTPPFSTVWKVVHFPLVLLVIGLAFMVAAGALSGLVSGVLAGLGADKSGPMAVVFGAVVAAIDRKSTRLNSSH